MFHRCHLRGQRRSAIHQDNIEDENLGKSLSSHGDWRRFMATGVGLGPTVLGFSALSHSACACSLGRAAFFGLHGLQLHHVRTPTKRTSCYVHTRIPGFGCARMEASPPDGEHRADTKSLFSAVHGFLTRGTVFLDDRIEGAGESIRDLARVAMTHFELAVSNGNEPLSSDATWLPYCARHHILYRWLGAIRRNKPSPTQQIRRLCSRSQTPERDLSASPWRLQLS
ncbi:hypothetical protein C8R47DRAFT_211742 [Mycena vitilis]|nr:hypothetical protein C8R47DRAFT_211742 [Mycena vitilis]